MTKKSGSPLLNSTYVTPSFQQTRQIINQDAVASIDALLASSSYPPGWVGQNGFTTVANWDYQRKTKTYEREFSANESYYSDHPGGCFLYWHSPLADCFNDDSGWAGMASLEGYMAYANKTYLDWAVSVHNVSAHLCLSLQVSSRLFKQYVSNHGFINDTVLQNGYLKGVHYANNTLQKTCDDKSMYGGVCTSYCLRIFCKILTPSHRLPERVALSRRRDWCSQRRSEHAHRLRLDSHIRTARG